MGKKYFDTKKGTLESSILGVWKTAAEENAVKMDGRTKGYKTHREKLEAARLRRETNKNNKSDDGEGLDAVQPKAVKKKFKDRKDKDIDNDGDTDDSDKFLHKKRKAISKAVSTKKEEADLDEEKYRVTNKDLGVWTGDARSEKEAKEKAMRKWGVRKSGPASVSFMKNTEIVKEEETTVKEAVEDVPAMEVGTDRYRDYVLEITPGEENPEWVKARDFKVQSMREALMKVWELDEKKDEPAEEEDEKISPVKGKKTMTGGKIAKVDTKPTIDG